MKRIIRVLLILLVCFSIKNVYAENYKVRQLVPYKVTTTIHTDKLNYIGMYFDDQGVHFNAIKNLTDEDLPISISIGLFNKKGINIGTINNCDTDLKVRAKTEMSYFVAFDKKYLGKNYNIKDIHYIAVLSENISCRTGGSLDYIGKKVDRIGNIENNKLDSQTQLFISIITVIAGAFVVFVVYKLIFTRAYRNIDGNEVRKAFEDIDKELEEMREEKTNVEEKSTEPIEILTFEEPEKDKKEDSELHNLYK